MIQAQISTSNKLAVNSRWKDLWLSIPLGFLFVLSFNTMELCLRSQGPYGEGIAFQPIPLNLFMYLLQLLPPWFLLYMSCRHLSKPLNTWIPILISPICILTVLFSFLFYMSYSDGFFSKQPTGFEQQASLNVKGGRLIARNGFGEGTSIYLEKPICFSIFYRKYVSGKAGVYQVSFSDLGANQVRCDFLLNGRYKNDEKTMIIRLPD